MGFGDLLAAGRLQLPALAVVAEQEGVEGGYQYIPAPAVCGEWALSHNSPTPKSQAELEFTWTAPESGTPILRAFLIEDCGLASGDCRSYQALTPVKVLYEAVFVDGLEEPAP